MGEFYVTYMADVTKHNDMYGLLKFMSWKEKKSLKINKKHIKLTTSLPFCSYVFI